MAPADDRPGAQRVALNFSWLLKLRWAAAIGQVVTILTVAFVLGVDLPLTLLFAITGVGALTNVALVLWSIVTSRSGGWAGLARYGEAMIGLVMVLDIVLLTGLLYVSGGPGNPFGIFYIVHVVLAAALLGPRWGWLLGVVACACWALLFAGSMPLPAIEVAGGSAAHAARASRLRLDGLFVAFATATFLILYFFTRLARELERLEAELVVARRKRAQGQRVAAMATLAAGAAHELSSPLSTIAVVAKELQRELARPRDLEAAAGDARLIRSEVDRCRGILDQMSADAGQSAGEGLARCRVEDLVRAIVEGLAGRDRVRVEVPAEAGAAALFLPKRALARALRGLVQNALDASGPGQTVAVEAQVAGGRLLLRVADEGPGMDAATLEQAGNPFFTTKEPGRGMGLGLFLARAVVEELGGSLDLDSVAGRGTIARVTLPQTAGGPPA